MSMIPIINPATLQVYNMVNKKHKAPTNDWEMFIFFRLWKLYTSRYHWTGLPKGCSSYWIERKLMEQGSVVAWKDKSSDTLMFATGTPEGVNMYNRPIYYRPEAPLTENFGFPERINLSQDEGVIIDDTEIGFPPIYYLNFWAKVLGYVKVKIEQNMRNMVTPFGVYGNKRAIKQFVDQANDILDGEPMVLFDEAIRANAKAGMSSAHPIETLDLNVQDNIDAFESYYEKLYSDCLTQLGINTINIQKKERLISAEADSNNDLISRFVDDGLEQRTLAAKEINRIFGEHVTVTANSAPRKDLENDNSEGMGSSKSHDTNDTASDE